MNPMFRSSFVRLGVFVAGFALAISSIHVSAQQDDSRRGRNYKTPPASSRIEVTILRASSGKPIESAAVIFHPIEGDRDKGGMELRTNEDGKVVIDVIPMGDTVRLQVIAKGFQTYGQDFKADKESMTMEIRMKRPGEQYSIYKNHETADSGAGSSGDKPANGAKGDAPAKPEADAKPSGSPSQADNQPSPSQPHSN
jgi:5-hydroxyisourate hydrolase-like protein (transthyretin family)